MSRDLVNVDDDDTMNAEEATHDGEGGAQQVQVKQNDSHNSLTSSKGF